MKMSTHNFNRLVGKTSIGDDLAGIDDTNRLTSSTFTGFKSLNTVRTFETSILSGSRGLPSNLKAIDSFILLILVLKKSRILLHNV